MNKAMLTGFLIGIVLVFTVRLIFFSGPNYSKPKSPINPQAISVDSEGKVEHEAATGDIISDLQNETDDEHEPETIGRSSDESPNPEAGPGIENALGESGSVPPAVQAERQMDGKSSDDLAQSRDNSKKAAFWKAFSSRPKAQKFVRYVSSILKVPCEAEKVEKGYQVFFRYSDPDDKEMKIGLLVKAGLLNQDSVELRH
ncbi:hypothetical protein [uncultured Desulfobacter sp.]|uniref:hypothetical protein n=1 Tax=uncultured Desulfobacter sp. TaxID=240139 RepID=UPI002AA6C366|nr:hypothetical protein [uncultured Desulfobacter sp.]